MAREGCNLNKDEAEILKPPSSSSSSTAAPPAPQPSQPTLFLKPPPDLAIQRSEILVDLRKQEADALVEEARTPAASPRLAGCKRKKAVEREPCPPPVREINRCFSCQRKVNLAGFRCRCGELFCSRHRYSDAHGCSFDYKAAGREEIARNNPVVRAAKIIKI